MGDVLEGPVQFLLDMTRCCQQCALHSLLGNALYRCLVIETEVTGVNDVVSLCVARKLIELAQVTCIRNELPVLCALTSLSSYL